jgi:hypothetical protein
VEIHLNSSHTAGSLDVNYAPRPTHPDYEVQIFLGDSFHTLYMSVEDTLQFVAQLLDAVPAEAKKKAALA